MSHVNGIRLLHAYMYAFIVTSDGPTSYSNIGSRVQRYMDE